MDAVSVNLSGPLDIVETAADSGGDSLGLHGEIGDRELKPLTEKKRALVEPGASHVDNRQKDST